MATLRYSNSGGICPFERHCEANVWVRAESSFTFTGGIEESTESN